MAGGLALAVAAATTGQLLIGYEVGSIGGALPNITYEFNLTAPGKCDFIKLSQKGAVISLGVVGALLGSLIAGPASDWVGRRGLQLWASALFLVAAVGMWWSPVLFALLSFRVLAGIAIGFEYTMVPAYLAECAPRHSRGRLSTVAGLGTSIGILLGFFFAFAVSPQWRLMLGASAFPSLVLIALLNYAPESPRWLVLQNRVLEARDVLARLRPPHFDIEEELAIILEGCRLQPTQHAGLEGHLLASDERSGGGEEGRVNGGALEGPMQRFGDDGPEQVGGGHAAGVDAARTFFSAVQPGVKTFRPFLIGMGLKFFQEACGITLILYYGPQILDDTGVDKLFHFIHTGRPAKTLATGLSYMSKFPAALLAMFLIDRVGRRPLLLATLPANCVALLGLALASALAEPANAALLSAKWLVALLGICSMSVFVAAFSMGIGPVSMVVMAEVFQTHQRGIGCGLSAATHWLTVAVCTQVFPMMHCSLGPPITIVVFASICVLAWLFVYLVVPETKGRLLEEIASSQVVQARRPRRAV